MRSALAVGIGGVLALVVAACGPPAVPTSTTTEAPPSTIAAAANPACDSYTPVGIGVSANFITTGDSITVIGFLPNQDALVGQAVEVRMALASNPVKKTGVIGTGTVQNASGYFYAIVNIPDAATLGAISLGAPPPATSYTTYWKFEVTKQVPAPNACTNAGSATVLVVG